MKLGDTEIMREKEEIRLVKCGCRNDRISYCVIGHGDTKFYTEYDDALEEFNLRWMKLKYD